MAVSALKVSTSSRLEHGVGVEVERPSWTTGESLSPLKAFVAAFVVENDRRITYDDMARSMD